MTYGPIDGRMTNLTFDCRNRLISAGDVIYHYDSENNRISTEGKDYIEEYVVDSVSSSLSRVLVMTRYDKTNDSATNSANDSANNTTLKEAYTTLYIYGNGLISEKNENGYLYHHYNNLGSTMKLTDEKGSEVAVYTYGPYGELLSGDKNSTHYLYNGQYGVSTDSKDIWGRFN